MLPRDENGFVADIENPTSNCFNEVDADGKDTGLVPANVVEDELDWHNEFVGQYTLTDVRYSRYVGINNQHCMYWKSSKNFADGSLYHITDSICINAPIVGDLFSIPAGQFFWPRGRLHLRLEERDVRWEPRRRCCLGGGSTLHGWRCRWSLQCPVPARKCRLFRWGENHRVTTLCRCL